MSKVARTIRLLLLLAGLAGIFSVAANATLAAHLQANATENTCSHDGCSNHHDSESEESHHDKEHCFICQILLGPAGKYISEAPTTFLVLIGQTPSEDILPTHVVSHHFPGTAEARAPPCV